MWFVQLSSPRWIMSSVLLIPTRALAWECQLKSPELPGLRWFFRQLKKSHLVCWPASPSFLMYPGCGNWTQTANLVWIVDQVESYTFTTKPFETLSWLGATLEVFLLLLFAQVSLRHRRLAWLPFIVWRSLVDSKRFSLLFTVSLRGCKGLRSTVQLPTNCSPPCEFWTFTHSPKSGDD